MKFTINKLPIGYINGIRRAILSDIKCVAIDDKNVMCIKNDTALHNEFMSHRISLIPCCIDPQHYDELASYVFEINVTNKGTVDLDVTSKDITVRIHDRVASAEERDAIFPPCKLTKDYILITVLHPSQTFHATFSPSVGTAKEHVRWCPVSTCTFYNSIASSDETKKGELESARKRVAPKDVPHFNALESQRFYSTNERGEPSCIKFVLESECQLSEPAIFRMGYEALCERIRRAPNKMTSKMHEDLFVVTFEGEDHLFGNVLQTYLYNNFYLKDAIMYCGYYVTHPLEPSVVLKIRGPSNVCNENFIRECTENLARDIETVGEKIYNHILK